VLRRANRSRVRPTVRISAGGAGTATTLASGLFGLTAIAVNATTIYWVENDNPGTVMKLAK
jgi:hypothetical protein